MSSGRNVRQGTGTGAGMGFRGGKGKPGYPLPDNLKDVIDNVVEDIISKLPRVGPGLSSERSEADVVSRSEPLEIQHAANVGSVLGEDAPKGDDLGFGFNEDGYPLQDRYEFQGMPVSVENSKGSVRKWYDENGDEKGSSKMYHDYGYIDGAVGSDGEPVDVYVGPDEDAEFVYVVHQNKAPEFEEYDEDKVMLGFASEEDAKDAYVRQYDDERFYGGMSSMPLKNFKDKVASGGKITNESVVLEADVATPKDLPKGIAHLEDMKPDEFLRFLERYVDLPLQGGLEVSEKVDGSARISFGVEGGKVWTQSKNGPRRTDASQYGDKPMFRALKVAHQALASKEKQIAGSWPDDVSFLVAEVLYTKIPNSIEYGPNVIMVHGVHKGDGSIVPETEGKKIVDAITRSTGGKLNDGKDEWKFEYKRIIRPEDVMVDVRNEYDSIREIYDELKKLEPNRLKAVGKAPYKAALEKFKAIQVTLKKKLVGRLRKQKSVYGPEGGDVEGIVFRDLESGALTKLVDKEYFTKLNKFLWHYRELLDKGVKIGDKWEFGIMQKFRNAIADNVFGAPVAKTPGFVQHLRKFGSSIEMPADVDTPEKKADYTIAQFIKSNKLMQGDYISNFAKELTSVKDDFDKIKAEWDSKKKGELVHDIKDDEGNVIKRVKMDKLIKDRTDEAFKGMDEFFAGIVGALADVQKMRGDLTKKTALMKILLGQNRLEKLQGLGEDEPKEEEIERLGESDDTENVRYISDDRSLLHNVKDKLAKRGITVPDQPRFLGMGTRARAYDIGGGKVMKLTSDLSDAEASLKLKGKNLRHVVKIFDVFRFPDTMMGRLYGIVSEKLDPISGTGKVPAAATGEAKRLNDAIQYSFMMEATETTVKSWEDVFRIMKTLMKTKIGEVGAQRSVDVQRRFIDSLQVLKEFQIPEMIDEIGAAGIDFHDYHAGNIMKRHGGGYAVVDLGYSSVAGAQEPEVLEAVMFESTSPDDVLKAYADKLMKRGLDTTKAKKLGEGFNGVAYLVGDKVLKITEDDSEARAANYIKRKNTKNIYRVFDVFAMPVQDSKWYGIVQEKLTPLSDQEKVEFDSAIRVVLQNLSGTSFKEIKNAWSLPPGEIMHRVERNSEEGGDEETIKAVQDAIDRLADFKFWSMLRELQSMRVQYSDVHSDNIMKRGSEYVVIDLGGSSQSPGTEPEKLEQKMVQSVLEALREARADQVGVTIGRFQPFHRGHAEIIRNLASKFDKVIVIVAGNTKDKKNPFSFETRQELIQRSLPDVASKVEIHKAQFGGKNSGYLPGVLSDIAKDKRSSVEADTAVHILVGPDRFADVKKQMEHAKGFKEQGGELFFDPSMAVVQELPGVKNDDDTDRISGTRVRQALLDDNREEVKRMMDPHLVSNPTDFEDLYTKMKEELGSGAKATKKLPIVKAEEGVALDEVIADIGGEEGVTEILKANGEALARSKWKIDVNRLRRLGGGQEGIAFDIGGGKVLKVTADNKEAETSYDLVNKAGNDHIVKIFDVFSFKHLAKGAPARTVRPLGSPAQAPAYGIVTEKLTPLSQAEIREFDDTTEEAQAQMGRKRYVDAIWTGDWQHFVAEMRRSFEEDIAKESDLPAGHPRLARVLDARMKKYTSVLEKFRVPEMMRELRALGVNFADYHGGNLMKRGSEYVINDLGRSQSKNKKTPPTLEGIMSSVVESVISEIGPFTGIGGSHTGMKAGSSAWSDAKNMSVTGSQDLWQNQLSSLQQHGTGSLPEDTDEAKKDPRREPIKGRTSIPDDQWIPFTDVSAGTPFKEEQQGVGNGEKKVMAELGAMVPPIEAIPVKGKGGFAATSDILIIKGGGGWDGNWEVKEVGGTATDIRPGTAGKGAGSSLIRNIKGVLDGLIEAFDGMDDDTKALIDPLLQTVQRYAPKPKNKAVAATMPPPEKVTVDEILAMLADLKNKLEHGEFAKGAMKGKSSKYPIGLLQIVSVISNFVKKFPPGKPDPRLAAVHITTTEDLNWYVDFLKKKNKKGELQFDKDMMNSIGANISNMFLSSLRGVERLVTDPAELDKEWLTGAPPSLTFKDVKGVIVVNEKDGFAFIPREDVDEYLVFDKITQGTPKYNLKKALKK